MRLGSEGPAEGPSCFLRSGLAGLRRSVGLSFPSHLKSPRPLFLQVSLLGSLPRPRCPSGHLRSPRNSVVCRQACFSSSQGFLGPLRRPCLQFVRCLPAAFTRLLIPPGTWDIRHVTALEVTVGSFHSLRASVGLFYVTEVSAAALMSSPAGSNICAGPGWALVDGFLPRFPASPRAW